MNGIGAANDVIGRFTTYIIDPMILVLFTAGLFLFMWGLVSFLWSMKDGDMKGGDTGKQHMIWGLVGMLIMISVYGIISMLDSTFGLNTFNGNINTNVNTTVPNNFLSI